MALTMNNDLEFNEKEQFQLLKKDTQTIAKIFDRINKIKQTDADFVPLLEKFIKGIPDGQNLGKVIDTLKKDYEKFIYISKKQRTADFKRAFNSYINELMESKIDYRMISNTNFRVKSIEIDVKPENSSIRFLFNKEVVTGWTIVNTLEDIKKQETEAFDLLKTSFIQKEHLGDIFYQAYLHALESNKRSKKTNPELVSISEFYKETRIELFRRDIEARKSDIKVNCMDFPKWAFLYNLDTYRKIQSALPDSQRLIFETGSQRETEKNGFVLNGLEAKADYKKFCYIRRG